MSFSCLKDSPICDFLENGIRQDTNKIKPAELLAGQVTVQSEKESMLSKRLRKMEKKDKSKYSLTEIKQLSIFF